MPLSDKDREDLVAYLDGELDPAAARRIEARLNADPNSRAEAIALRRTWELLDYLPRAEPSPHFTHRTLQRLAVQTAVKRSAAGRGQRRGWVFGVGWAAAVLLAVAAGYAGVHYLSGDRPAEPARETVTADQSSDDSFLVQNLRVVENRRLYENVDDLDYLRALDDPDLFGEVDVD
jgi:anti-sigma factor RsiW